MGMQININKSNLKKAGWVEETSWKEVFLEMIDDEPVYERIRSYYWVKGEYKFKSYSPSGLCVDFRCNEGLLREAGLLDLPHWLS